NTRAIPAATPRKVNSSATAFSVSLRAGQMTEEGESHKQERFALLADPATNSLNEQTYTAVRSELFGLPIGPRSPISPRSKDADDAGQPAPCKQSHGRALRRTNAVRSIRSWWQPTRGYHLRLTVNDASGEPKGVAALAPACAPSRAQTK